MKRESVCHEVVSFTQPHSHTYWGGCGQLVSGCHAVVLFTRLYSHTAHLLVVTSCDNDASDKEDHTEPKRPNP